MLLIEGKEDKFRFLSERKPRSKSLHIWKSGKIGSCILV